MRHRKSGRKLGRKSGPRRALERSIVGSLFTHGRIVTTEAKAKAFRPAAEKLITMARRANVAKESGNGPAWLHAYRRAIAALGGNRDAERLARQLFEEIAPQFRDRNGGYTRLIRAWRGRLGDNAPQVVFELVGYTRAEPEAPEGAEGGAGETGEGSGDEAPAGEAPAAAKGKGKGKAGARKRKAPKAPEGDAGA